MSNSTVKILQVKQHLDFHEDGGSITRLRVEKIVYPVSSYIHRTKNMEHNVCRSYWEIFY